MLKHVNFALWYLFKSPQRKLGWYTLLLDLQGIVIYLYRKYFPRKKLRKVTICTGIKNRTQAYLSQVVESCKRTHHPHLIELSVVDCSSDDIDNLEQAIKKNWNGPLHFSVLNIPFMRSHSFNKAVEQSITDIVFLCDADMTVPPDIVKLCNNYTGKKISWFPIVYNLFKNKPPVIAEGNGEWLVFRGKGMMACEKKDFIEAGKLSEAFTTWGGEDDEFWERLLQKHFIIIRNKQPGLLHHWHPSLNPALKNHPDWS